MADDRLYRILVINPGSTSSKIALFENEKCVHETSIFHDAPLLMKFPKANAQLDFRKQVILGYLHENGIDPASIDVWVGRGGSSPSVTGGTYRITDLLVRDTRKAMDSTYHPAGLGVQLAAEFCREYGGEMFMVDSPQTDEFCDLARMTGIRKVYRRSRLHALNLKGTARAYAESAGRRYEDMNLIVCHIDGGMSISAHRKGLMIDGNDAAGGDGSFTPTRIGSMAVTDVLDYIEGKNNFESSTLSRPSVQDAQAAANDTQASGAASDAALRANIEELRHICIRAGGFVSHFGTSDKQHVWEMVESGDETARRVWDAMAYQISKAIGAMATVLEGEVDAIVLGGGLCNYEDLTKQIEKRCGWIAPVKFYHEEFEHRAMAAGALRVMRGEEEPKEYTGRPVWSGFSDVQ